MKQNVNDALRSWLAGIGDGVAVEAMAGLVPDAAVFAVDRDRNIVLWSEGAERLLGYTADEVVGAHCLKANRCQQCMVGCGIAQYGAVRDAPLVLYRADGEAVAVRKTARAFFDADGTFAGGIEVLVPGPVVDEVLAPANAVRDPKTVIFHGLESADPEMHQVFTTCRNVAETEVFVLVRGESGTGKQLVARAIHEESGRRSGPFVAVNCAALTATLMESELFGHVKGAFTGAVRDREGIFRQADGGTLFLDEVAGLPLDLQAKLLRVLEERTVTPVGGSKALSVDVRIVAATHQSLRALVASGRFREDLMLRLSVVPLFIPPLRERRRDITMLMWRFIREWNAAGPRVVESLAPDATRALLDHPWRGNVRELRDVIDYAFAVGRGPEIRRSELPPELRTEAVVHEGVADDEAEAVRRALQTSRGNIGEAAALLGVSRPTLWRRRKKYGL